MSTPGVTPDLLRRVEAAWEGNTASDAYVRCQLRDWAKRLEREAKPLPTVPGWYPNVAVERGGESCTGAIRTQEGIWGTALPVDYSNYHDPDDRDVTIRWAEQDGTTPGQALWEEGVRSQAWSTLTPLQKDRHEHAAAAVLAAHGTPTLTPVGEHPEPGTRGLLPVKVDDDNEWNYEDDFTYVCDVNSETGRTILADPRPDDAQ